MFRVSPLLSCSPLPYLCSLEGSQGRSSHFKEWGVTSFKGWDICINYFKFFSTEDWSIFPYLLTIILLIIFNDLKGSNLIRITFVKSKELKAFWVAPGFLTQFLPSYLFRTFWDVYERVYLFKTYQINY